MNPRSRKTGFGNALASANPLCSGSSVTMAITDGSATSATKYVFELRYIISRAVVQLTGAYCVQNILKHLKEGIE